MFALGAVNSDNPEKRYNFTQKSKLKPHPFFVRHLFTYFRIVVFWCVCVCVCVCGFRKRDLETGEGIAAFCMDMYRRTVTRLSPEYVEVDLLKKELKLPPGDGRAYIMRPGSTSSFSL
jgi:hypothetical protein